jgi:outer membrane lipoprotein-sorting protein
MSSRGHVLVGILAGLCLPATLMAADGKAHPPGLTAAQIVAKNVAARGGLQAWQAVQTMSWSGNMDAGVGDSMARSETYVRSEWDRRGRMRPGAPTAAGKADATAKGQGPDKAQPPKQVELPFVLEMKRPGKSRVELKVAGKTAIQVYDGGKGWLKRPYLNRDDWEPFGPEQARSQADTWGLDNPLFDYAAKGTKVALEGVEKIDGRDAYQLKLTLKNGKVHRVWIDAQSFLDVRIEGTPRRMDGRMRTVWITQRDFRSVQGVKVPFVLETSVDGYSDTHRMVLDKVAVNPKLDDSRFTKPGA